MPPLMGTPAAELATQTDMTSFANRPALVAGLTFLEGTSAPGWTVRELGQWFDAHVLSVGMMGRPLLVTEPSAGTVAFYPGAERTQTGATLLPKVLIAARIRVVTSLRGLIESPVDDRFLAAAIFAGRVRRQRLHGEPTWVARPEPTAPLSGIVQSLFAIDILSHRDSYDRSLSVCDACGRVSFQDEPARRRACHEHPTAVSGYSWKATPRRIA